MRQDDDDDPKRRPRVAGAAKDPNAPEVAEVRPWLLRRKDPEHDHHRHVC